MDKNKLPSANPANDSPTSIPVQTFDPDQLPREKGLSYDEVATIVGSLYLDSHHQMKVREDQFSAIVDEYDKHIMQLKAELQTKQGIIVDLQGEVAVLQRELEARNAKPKRVTTSSNDRDSQMCDN